MARKKPITVDHLWQMERVGALSLSPDGAQVVTSVSRYSMDDNKASSTLWLLSTLGGQPRPLTQCGDKDGQPRFSPQGDRIGFIARREQQGRKDEEAQFYAIAVDGGEAQRLSDVATGIEAFRWCPDGRRIVFTSWVWPGLKGSAAQAKALKAHKSRKESGYATSEGFYRYWDHFIPMGRVAHLHVLDTATGKLRDLFEGSGYELSRSEPDGNSFDVSPDGRKAVFAYDPAADKRSDGRFALAEIDLRSGKITPIAVDAQWNFSAPRYSADGARVAFIAAHKGLKHTQPGRLAIWERGSGHEVLSTEWDHEVQGPLLWTDDGEAVLLAAEDQGQRHLWRFDLATRSARVMVKGGWLQAWDGAAGTLVTAADAANHPVQVQAHALVSHENPVLGQPSTGSQRSLRIERFNDGVMAGLQLGRHEPVWVRGAQGDKVQVWLFYPPGFDASKKYPLLQVIHGGPHTSVGDNWHYRWNNAAFAAQGYVVAVVNYHGSTGFGYAFTDSITHRWGELELQDLEAATTALLRKPFIDKQRVFAAGGSYGGYMVAWMNGHVKPGRYRAYVCHAGCFDWTAMFADDAWAWHAKELGAWYWDDLDHIHKQSPHAFASAMHTPTLVIHGALDYRVPDAQGLAYYNTLKARDVDARLLWFADENHWILKPRNSRQWYGEFFAWLAQHDPARAADKLTRATGAQATKAVARSKPQA